VTADEAAIARLDRFWSRAWPAAALTVVEGWQCRLDAGVSRRANSVLAVDGPADAIGVERRIAAVEDLYRRHRLPPCFQISQATRPGDLDGRLAERGYVAIGKSLVLSIPVARLAAMPARHRVDLADDPSEIWLGVAFAEAERTARGAIVRRIAVNRRFALVTIDGAPAAAAALAWSDDLAGLFAVATVPHFRRRRAASAIFATVGSLLAGQGLPGVTIQVESGNTDALAFYRTLGFAPVYRYHYRLRHDA
jgi:ribosomal protein S18 acetylase RimI-like enzyme